MARPIVIEFKIKKFAHGFDGSRISHLNAERKNISRRSMSSSRLTAFNRDASFAINQSSKVGFVLHEYEGSTNQYQTQELFAKKSANSVDTLMPRGMGNTEPSNLINQVGVCREHGLTPKGMMCSDLTSNCELT